MTLKMKAAATLLLGVTLAGCASGPGGPSSYSAELDQLRADCRSREGILTPTGSQTAHPQRDYACKITGGASRLD